MKPRQDYMNLAEEAVDQARKAGAGAAEAFISDSEKVEIFVSKKDVESLNASSEAGIGIRILKDQKMIFGSSNELSKDSVKDLIWDLIKKVPFHTPDEFNAMAEKDDGPLGGTWSKNTDLISYDPKITEVPIKAKIERAIALETGGLDYSPKITGSMWAAYSDQASIVYLANSNGLSGWHPTSGCSGEAQFSAAEGDDHQSGTRLRAAARYDDLDPARVGRMAAEDAVRMLGARSVPSCETPMLVAPDVGVALLGYIVAMLSADDVLKGKSLFGGKIGETVASGAVTLIDDGRLKGGLATQPVDAEGVPRQTTPLIVDGVLRTFLYDCYNARKAKTRSTGNRVRSGYQDPGSIGSTNLYLKPGTIKPEDILKETQEGLYLTVAFGLHAGINNVTGDFSIPIAGFKIEGGELTFPIRGVNIAGNLFTFLKSVNRVGDALTWIQATGCPTFSVESVKIGGE